MTAHPHEGRTWAVVMLVLIPFVAAGVGVYLLRQRIATGPRRRREAALRQVAVQLGFTYERERDPFAQEPFLDRGLFDAMPQFSRAFYGFPHVLQGETTAGPVRIFDVWHGGFGDGKSDASSPYRLTVAGFRVGGAKLPPLHIFPETGMRKVGDALWKAYTDTLGKDWRDIDFATHPVFSDRYSLRSNDEDAVRGLFAPRFLEFWESLTPEDSWAAAGSVDSVVVYQQAPWTAGRVQEIAPRDIEPFLRGAERVALAFRAASGESARS